MGSRNMQHGHRSGWPSAPGTRQDNIRLDADYSCTHAPTHHTLSSAGAVLEPEWGWFLFVVLFYIIMQSYVAANHTPLSQCPGSPATKSWLSKSSKVNFYRWWRISVPLECAPTPAALRHTPATASSHTTTKAVTQSHRHKRQITQKTLKQTKDQK